MLPPPFPLEWSEESPTVGEEKVFRNPLRIPWLGKSKVVKTNKQEKKKHTNFIDFLHIHGSLHKTTKA